MRDLPKVYIVSKIRPKIWIECINMPEIALKIASKLPNAATDIKSSPEILYERPAQNIGEFAGMFWKLADPIRGIKIIAICPFFLVGIILPLSWRRQIGCGTHNQTPMCEGDNRAALWQAAMLAARLGSQFQIEG